MLIPLSNIRIINERIRELVNISYTSVIIFTALDLDSLCTYVILTVHSQTLRDYFV